MKRILIIIAFVLTFTACYSQNDRDKDLIQFTGTLLSADSLYYIPFASVSVINKPYGTLTNLQGYFSLVAKKGDTIAFSHVEFKTAYLVVPDTLRSYKYSILQFLTPDTFYLPGVVVMPMPNRATFDQAFINKDIANDDMARAYFNMELEALKERSASMENDASEAYGALVYKQMQQSYYSGGQIAPMNIMNPFAWAAFFQAWQNGDYKKKDKKLVAPKK
jgi:hypothetical protein